VQAIGCSHAASNSSSSISISQWVPTVIACTDIYIHTVIVSTLVPSRSEFQLYRMKITHIEPQLEQIHSCSFHIHTTVRCIACVWLLSRNTLFLLQLCYDVTLVGTMQQHCHFATNSCMYVQLINKQGNNKHASIEQRKLLCVTLVIAIMHCYHMLVRIVLHVFASEPVLWYLQYLYLYVLHTR
jgi:hypothetical protein